MKTLQGMLLALMLLANSQAEARFLTPDPVKPDPSAGQNFNRYWYADNNPVKNVDPDGRECITTNGSTSCTPGKKGDGLPTVTFPAPKGFPAKISNSNILHHEYRYETDSEGKADKSVQQSIVNNPTPGKDSPATSKGTSNDASPVSGSRKALSALSDSPVKSYAATDKNGNTWTINVTEPGHPLFPGYVLRGAVDGTTITYGEGVGAAQAFGPASQILINDVWKGQNQQNIDDAK
jgi:hypothetical protein